MLRMSVALIRALGVSQLLAVSPSVAEVPDPVMAAQATVGTGAYPCRYSNGDLGYTYRNERIDDCFPRGVPQASQYINLRAVL